MIAKIAAYNYATVSKACEIRAGLVRSLILVAMVLSGCATGDRSIVPGESPNPSIENGIAYDSGMIDLHGVRNIIVPTTSVVWRAKRAKEGLIVMEKKLGVSGSPAARVSIADRRKEIGCAYKREGDSLVVGTYGEYLIPGHGGAHVRLAVYVPEGVTVDKRAELCGEDSLAQKGDSEWHRLGCTPVDSEEASQAFPQ